MSTPLYTNYVTTRWYRAPECVLKQTNYNSPVDIWAIRAIMPELYNFKPLFPGSIKDPNSSPGTNLKSLKPNGILILN